MLRPSSFGGNHGLFRGLAAAGGRGFGGLPPTFDVGDGSGGRLEVPVLSLISLTVSTCIWLASLDRGNTIRRRQEPNVSLREFLDTYLRNDRVKALYVLGRDSAEAHLNSGRGSGGGGGGSGGGGSGGGLSSLISSNSSTTPATASYFRSFLKQLTQGSGSSLSQQRDRSSERSAVRFRLDDPSYLECLVSAYCKNNTMPPVYHVPSTENVMKWQKRLLFGSALAATFWSVAYKAPIIMQQPSNLSSHQEPRNSSTSITKHYHDQQPPSASPPSGPDRLMKFGQIQSRNEIPNVSFSDVAGLDQAKVEIQEFVEFLKNPDKFRNLGANVPKGALLVGPPGTGKTLLAKAVAGEAKVPFFSTSGSDFIEMFVGVGSSRIRDLFEKARQSAPSIVFIDEIDTIGRNRSSSGQMGNGGTDERESTLNALLVELDGFNSTTNIVTLAGTNRGDVLDPALTRPGRFDRRIALSKPSIHERMAIFEIHLRPIKLDPNLPKKVLSQRLAALTPGFSGAEIKNVCNEAAILAARRDAHWVGLMDFETSVERLIGGLKHSGDVLNVAMQRQVAIHEAGHAICGWFLAEADPILKLSIVPRANGALGYTQMLPDDVLLSTKESIEDKIAVLLGGRVAEQLFCSTMTTGASDDLERASKICRAYVCNFGFDEIIGLRNYGLQDGYHNSPMGNEVRNQIEARIDLLLKEQWNRAHQLLQTKKNEIEQISNLLIKKEVISYKDLELVLGPIKKKITNHTREFVEALP